MKRILIVDDDPEIIGSLAMLLAEKYEVSVASDGFTALKRLRSGAHDLILLDLLMPGLDGAGFVHEIVAQGNRIPVLLMSASPSIEKQAKGLAVADYLGKPFHIDTLEAKIDRILAIGQAPGVGENG